MKLKKILALSAAAIMILGCAACGNKEVAEDSTVAAETTVAAQVEDTTAAGGVTDVAEETSAAEENSEVATEAETEAGAEVDTRTPDTIEGIVELYKKAAAETDKTKPKSMTKMELTSLDGGQGAVGALLNIIEPAGRKALERNSTENDDMPGGFEKLTAADVTSATATNDGKFTNVRINLKNQTDGLYGKSEEGSVGHGVGVLDGVQTAIDEIGGLEVDATGGKLELLYNNAYIDVKIDNATGKIVSGKWHHNVNVTIDNVVGKAGIIKMTLKGAKLVINYTITM